MQDKMRIVFENGKVFQIELAVELFGGKQLLIVLADDRLLSEIALDFEGCSTLSVIGASEPEGGTLYDGYTRLLSIQRTSASGLARVTVERP